MLQRLCGTLHAHAGAVTGSHAPAPPIFASQTPGETVDKWLPLGRGAFSDEEGCGGGYGEVHVKLTYWPFELMRGHTGATLWGGACRLLQRAVAAKAALAAL